MLKLKTTPLAAAAVAALSASAFALAPMAARAQEHPVHAADAPSDAQIAEHERQLGVLLAALLEETDFEAVKAHVTSVVSAHAEEIGGDPEQLSAHVSAFLDQVAAHIAADPQSAGEHAAHMLIDAHRAH